MLLSDEDNQHHLGVWPGATSSSSDVMEKAVMVIVRAVLMSEAKWMRNFCKHVGDPSGYFVFSSLVE